MTNTVLVESFTDWYSSDEAWNRFHTRVAELCATLGVDAVQSYVFIERKPILGLFLDKALLTPYEIEDFIRTD